MSQYNGDGDQKYQNQQPQQSSSIAIPNISSIQFNPTLGVQERDEVSKALGPVVNLYPLESYTFGIKEVYLGIFQILIVRLCLKKMRL